MKRLLAGLATIGLTGFGVSSSGERSLPGEDWLAHRLIGADQAKVPGSDLLPDGYSLCAAGSYQFDLPDGYETAEHELEHAGLLPVREGSGLLFSLDGNLRVHQVSTLSVWPGMVMLEAADPVCILATLAQLDLRREGTSIIIELSNSN